MTARASTWVRTPTTPTAALTTAQITVQITTPDRIRAAPRVSPSLPGVGPHDGVQAVPVGSPPFTYRWPAAG